MQAESCLPRALARCTQAKSTTAEVRRVSADASMHELTRLLLPLPVGPTTYTNASRLSAWPAHGAPFGNHSCCSGASRPQLVSQLQAYMHGMCLCHIRCDGCEADWKADKLAMPVGAQAAQRFEETQHKSIECT